MDLNLLPNNAMTFSENQHGNAVLEKLKTQRDKSRYCDVILHVDGKKHFAHRCVLSACSPFFDSFFKASKTVREQITISSQSSEVVLTLLTYMYTGTVIIDTKNVSDLLKLADTFLLCKLKEYCVEYLQRYLDTRNCLTIWEMANRFGLDSLQKNANSHIAIHIKEVLKGEEVLEISQARLENFITNSSWHVSNENILSLISSWVFHTPEERESSFRSLLTFVSWKQLNPEAVVSLLQVHPLFASSKKCRSFIIDVLNENNLLCDSTYKKIVDLKDSDTEKLNLEDDNDSFINMAITTAINESNVEKYLMDSRRELLKEDLTLPEQPHYENSVMGESSDPNSEDRPVINRNKIILHSKHESTPHSEPTNLQTIDLEELCKYTLENTQKQRSYLSETISDGDRVSPALKDCDYEAYSYGDTGCLQYKDFREGDHFKGQNKGCPKFTNKISYMNYKYDVNHSTFNDSFNPKNSTDALNFSSPTHLLDFSKDGALNLMSGNYSDDHLGLHMNQEHQYQSVEPLSPIGYKAEHFAVTEDIVSDVKGVFSDRNVNLNSMAYIKTNCVSTSQPEFLYMDCSNDTQSSNNYPKDMSLSYLKLSEFNNAQEFYHNKDEFHNTQQFYQNEDNTYAGGSTNDLPAIDDAVKGENDQSASSCSNLQQSYNNSDDISHSIYSFESKNKEINQENSGIETRTPQTGAQDKQSEGHSGKAVEKNNGRRSSKKSEKKKRISEKKSSKRKKKKQVIEPTKKVLKTCDICEANFEKKRHYFVHMVEHFKGPPFCCDTCKSKFQRIYYLLDHRLTHLEKKQFECPESQCSFATNKMFNLKEHMALHTSEKPFKCDECGDSFSRKQYLIVHMTKHTNERPLICETCGWSAKTRNSLLIHSKIHSGDLYNCQYSDCPYRTAKKSHLKEHMQFHTKSRPFACKFCGTRFITKAHVARHLRKHETPNLHQCTQCDYCASRIDSLKRHIKQKHSTSKPKLRFRTGQLRKKDALLSNKKTEISPSSDQTFTPNLNNSSNRLSPNSLPLLSESFSQYHPPSPSHSPCTFGAPGDPDDPLTIVSEIEDTHSPYLNSNIGQAFSGLLDSSCGADRFTLTSNDDLYYT